MNRSTNAACTAAGLGIGLAAGLAITNATAQPRVDQQPHHPAYTFRGDFTVLLATDARGQRLPLAQELRRVADVTLLDDWAIIEQNAPNNRGTVILPRERVLHMTLTD